MFVPIDQVEESQKRYKTYQKVSVRSSVAEIESELLKTVKPKEISPEVTKGNIIGDKENLKKRKAMLERVSQEPADFAFERAIGKNDSVYSNFIELMLETKRKVGRIVKKTGALTEEYATGFMITQDLLMTNWHVFHNKAEVSDSVVQFNYEYDINGNPKSPITFLLDEDKFFYSLEELDYCVVGIKSMDVGNKISIGSIGYIDLNPALGKLGNENQELLNIIHHPGGDYKQLSIRENQFEKIMPTTLWYRSDTAQGSSGSPVFNDQWQPVALHHMGVPSKKGKDYLDKDGNIIPVVDGKIDVSKVHWIANEGIRISVIVKDLFLKFPDSSLISKISDGNTSTVTDQIGPSTFIHQDENKPQHMSRENINISIPPSVLSRTGELNIRISQNGTDTMDSMLTIPNLQSGDSIEALLLESKKLEKEIDYSQCKGYQPNFLGAGFEAPIPLPKADVLPKIAKITNSNSIVLNYFKFSAVHHSERKMPIISAVNIDGSPGVRKDESKRKDTWIRDRRIDFFVQLNYEDFYLNSGFDRGHMSRREDANWGSTAEQAKRNADLTCVYTNACPQVPSLNRSSRNGLWGELENIVLEKGAIKEGPGMNKISVFNGPIFQQSDPWFKGIQIPTDYFKIILWIGEDEKLKATAFRLSQIDLLDNIDLEAIDIDQNIEFKPFQRSIKSIEKDTKLDFSGIIKFDTFSNAVDPDAEITLESLKL